MRTGRLLALAVRRQFLEWAGTWWFTASLVVNYAIGPLIGLVVWSAVLPGDARIVRYFVALVAVHLLTASFEDYTFAESVYDGKISARLLEPQPVVLGPAGENLAIRLWLALFGLPLTVVVALVTGATYRWQDVLLALPSLVLAAVLRFLWTWLLALAAFWTERVHAIVALGNILVFLLGGIAAPLADLPASWQSVASLLPFHAMLGLPADIASGTLPASGVALQAGWCVVFALAAVVVWRSGVRRYTAVGA
ncbi:ABC-2 family transporter protein [Amycolatopsis carbonis]|uniref:ABC-2 family transporter protein n=1 Tax=Amycolatopsis carbonis TaxID=715471 RepID=A0A9Y2MT06_9PSEU|nr:ABC-2 family transporter protein [Amycolatopsis sp. 2-15]WIX80140.1 ABC-2 family transporter protein [Amycolatopsis sp. 2-15]